MERLALITIIYLRRGVYCRLEQKHFAQIATVFAALTCWEPSMSQTICLPMVKGHL